MHLILTHETILNCSQPEQENRSDRRGYIKCNQALAFARFNAHQREARRTGLSRNTVKKYLAGNIVEPHYPRRRSPSSLDAYALKLTHWLQLETSRNRKQRRSLKQLHADLVLLG